MFFDVRCTDRRGRSPATFLIWRRTRCARRSVASLVPMVVFLAFKKRGPPCAVGESASRDRSPRRYTSWLGLFRKVCDFSGPTPLLLLAFLADDLLASVTDALALVGLG